MVYASLASSDMQPGLTLMTWSARRVTVTDTAPFVRLNGEASVEQADIACSNGSVHVLGRVAVAPSYAFPEPLKDILELARSTAYLQNVAAGAELTGLEADYADPRSEFVPRHWVWATRTWPEHTRNGL